MRRSVAAKAVIGAAVAAALAAGCSSSANSGGTGTSAAATNTVAGSGSSAAAVAATGTPVKIMITAVKNTPVLAQQEQFDAATAKVDYLNDHGGVNGHKVVLEICDTKLDPNAEEACLKKAVSDNVSAVVGATLLFSDLKTLEAANVPLIGDQGITPVQLQSKISYPFGSIIAWFGGMVQMAKTDSVKTLAVDYLQTDSAKFSDGIVLSQAKKSGITVVTNLGTALTTTDYTADAATLTKGNPDGIAVIGSTGTAPPLIKAIKAAGYSGKIYCLSADFTEQNLSQFKSDLEGVRISNSALPVTSDDPTVKQYIADVKKYVPGAKLDANGELGWAGVDLYAQIMKDATSFTGADVIAAASKVSTPITAGPFGPWVGTGTSPIAAFPRMVNHSFIPSTIKKGVIVPDGDFQDAAAE
jgi:ABC-type branched-subunit amino acid transport system substrate-binding protein